MIRPRRGADVIQEQRRLASTIPAVLASYATCAYAAQDASGLAGRCLTGSFVDLWSMDGTERWLKFS